MPAGAETRRAAPGRAPKSRTTRRVRTPTVLQMEAVECGAACLCIILRYFGKYLPLETLRIECGVARDGSKALSIVKAARRHGLIVTAYRKEPEQLKELPVPMIVHWNFNHFVVVEGFKRGRVYLNDPATGPRTVSEEEFDQAFTGVVITFRKGDDFVPGGKPHSIVAALRSRLVGSEAGLVYALLAGLVLVVPELAIPVFTQFFIDEILLGGMQAWLPVLLAGLLVTGLVRVGVTWLQQYCLVLLEARLILSMSSRFLWHVLRLPVSFFTQRFAGELSTRVMSNYEVAKAVSRDLTATLLNLFMLVFYLVLMLRYNVELTLLSVAVALLNIAYLRAVARQRVDQNQKLLLDRGKLEGKSMAGLLTIESLKASGMDSDFFAYWAGTQANLVNAEQALRVSSAYLNAVPAVLQSLSAAAILALGGLAVMNGELTIGMLVAFQYLAAGFVAPVNELVNKGAEYQEVQGHLSRLDDVLNHPFDVQWQQEAAKEAERPAAESAAGGRLVVGRSVEERSAASDRTGESAAALDAAEEGPRRLSGAVSLRGVTFGYSPLEPPLIENFSLEQKPGDRVALVGASGSGKSTIAKLIAGIYVPWSGEILFDGRPRSQVPRHVMAASLAVVDQEIHLFDGTLWDNLTLWDETIDEAAVTRAIRDAAAAEIVAERPGGYDYHVEEGGRNFSGGQRQRLEIARALVNDPSILVMDEATSALDARTEFEVMEAIRRRGCTCIIVAHRLSTIRDCDEIIVLSQGKVVERGSHAELMRLGGAYAKLVAEL